MTERWTSLDSSRRKLEHGYEVCHEAALRQRGPLVNRRVSIPVRHLDVDLHGRYRIDMRFEREVVVDSTLWRPAVGGES